MLRNFIANTASTGNIKNKFILVNFVTRFFIDIHARNSNIIGLA